jgi:hypothetical protein
MDGFKHRFANWFSVDRGKINGKDRSGVKRYFENVLVVIGEPLHSIQSTYRRFKWKHVNKWRMGIGKRAFGDNVKLQDIWNWTISSHEDILGIKQYLWSWLKFCKNNTQICRIVTTKQLYSNARKYCEFLSNCDEKCSDFNRKFTYRNRPINGINYRKFDVPNEVVKIYARMYKEFLDSFPVSFTKISTCV